MELCQELRKHCSQAEGRLEEFGVLVLKPGLLAFMFKRVSMVFSRVLVRFLGFW